jgi:hypothetical protein
MQQDGFKPFGKSTSGSGGASDRANRAGRGFITPPLAELEGVQLASAQVCFAPDVPGYRHRSIDA